MGKVIAIKQYFVGFSGVIFVECIDLNVACNAFQILQCFDVSFVQLDRLNGGY